jgi:hypothetical protein
MLSRFVDVDHDIGLGCAEAEYENEKSGKCDAG